MRERGYFSPPNLNVRKASGMKPFRHLKAHSSKQQGWFFSFIIFLTNWSQMLVPGLLFDAYVGIHQVRILVFENYQKYTLPLKAMDTFSICQRRVLCAFRCLQKVLGLNTFSDSKYLSDKLPLPQRLCYFRGVVSQNILYNYQLSMVSFDA